LIEKLTKEKTYDTNFQEESAKLDAFYNAKQIAAEKKATGELENVHMKNQMNLRQKQIQEMANVVSLYTDPETLSRLHSSTGKSQEDELLEVQYSILSFLFKQLKLILFCSTSKKSKLKRKLEKKH
jgi:hypothetical protein